MNLLKPYWVQDFVRTPNLPLHWNLKFQVSIFPDILSINILFFNTLCYVYCTFIHFYKNKKIPHLYCFQLCAGLSLLNNYTLYNSLCLHSNCSRLHCTSHFPTFLSLTCNYLLSVNSSDIPAISLLTTFFFPKQ